MQLPICEVKACQAGQIEDAVNVLSKAFFDDPAMKYMIPEGAIRANLSPRIWLASVNYGILYGNVDVVTTENNEVIATAVWVPPYELEITPWRLIRSGILSAYLRVGIRRVLRGLNYLTYAEDKHKALVGHDRPHWYLYLLAVDPAYQNKGVGSLLLSSALKRVKQDNLPCYLETANPNTINFYQSRKFNLVGEGIVPKGGPKIWSFLRNPN